MGLYGKYNKVSSKMIVCERVYTSVQTNLNDH